MKTTRFLATTIAAVLTAVMTTTMVIPAFAAGPAKGDGYVCTLEGDALETSARYNGIENVKIIENNAVVEEINDNALIENVNYIKITDNGKTVEVYKSNSGVKAVQVNVENGRKVIELCKKVNYTNLNADLAEVKPTLSLSRIELPINEAKENPVQTIELSVSGAEQKYASTGIHVYFDDRLDLVPFANGRIAKAGDALDCLTPGKPRVDTSAPEGYEGFFAATMGEADDGFDGVMWTFQVQIPENVQVGDTFPIEIFYRTTGAGDTFRNRALDDACAYMETYLFTKGIEQGYITITEESVPVVKEDEGLGDVDGDNKINAADASRILGAYSALTTGGETGFTEAQLKAADINKDTKIDAKDATAALGYYGYTSTGGTASIAEFMELGL